MQRWVGWICSPMIALACVVLPLATADDADEAELLAKAQALGKRMRTARKAKDSDAVAQEFEPLIVLHNKLQDAKARKSLQTRLGAVLSTEGVQDLFPRTVEALLLLNDARGAYRKLQPFMPTKAAEDVTDNAKVILAALRAKPNEAAVSRLIVLTEDGRAAAVRADAVDTLGHYAASPRVAEILRVLMAALKKGQPQRNAPLVGSWIAEWQLEGPALLGALNRITGSSVEHPAAWIARYKEKPRDLASLLDGSRPLKAVPPAAGENTWRKMRAALGRPKKAVRASIDAALTWLAAHQTPDGAWEAANFGAWCHGKAQVSATTERAGRAIYDVGVSGLALTAFLVAGYDGTGTQAFDRTVRKGLARLISVQDEEGCFGPRIVAPAAQGIQSGWAGTVQVPGSRVRRPPSQPTIDSDKNRAAYVYNHAVATLALVEAAALTGDARLRGAAQKGLDFIALARNPYFGWRYGIKPGDNDTSVTTWMTLVLGTANMVNAAELRAGGTPYLIVDPACYEGARAWLDKATDPDYGRAGYTQRGTGPAREVKLFDHFPSSRSESATAGGVYVRMLTGQNPRTSKIIKLGLDLIAALPPEWNPTVGSIDMIHWHLGALATHGAGGKYWQSWQKGMEKALLGRQRGDGDVGQELGTWDPIGAWGRAGGRVYSTAINVLTLLTPQRYPAFSRK